MEYEIKRYKLKDEDIINTVHNYDVDLRLNHIYLMGVDRGYDIADGTTEEPGVDFVMANRFIKNINLCARSSDQPITVFLKSMGGDWHEGMAIYDAIKSCPNPVTILNYTHARSMSSIIFQAANKRVMMPHSVFMLHEGEMGIYGTQKQVVHTVEFYKKTTDIMIDIYASQMKDVMKEQEARKWLRQQMDLREDVYLTAEQTVKYGLADEIFDYSWTRLTDYTDEQLAK